MPLELMNTSGTTTSTVGSSTFTSIEQKPAVKKVTLTVYKFKKCIRMQLDLNKDKLLRMCNGSVLYAKRVGTRCIV